MKLSLQKSLIMSLIAASAFAVIWLYLVFAPIVTQPAGAIYYLRPGTSKKLMMTELSQQGVMTHPAFFAFYVYLHANTQLKTGEYFFAKDSSIHSIWKQMSTGTGLYYRPFAIIPGWTFAQLKTQLAQVDGIKHLTTNMTDQQIATTIGAQVKSLEGQFFPETYNYTKGDLDTVILKRAYLLMQTRLNTAWNQRAPNLPYPDAYAALIAASLIEKEAYLEAERPVIADVIINRLNRKMLLQIDATVIYGLGDQYTGKIYKKDLLQNTPYNTYVNVGLPPTPIAMPSMASINAALHPIASNYLYYVAKGDGSHQFSDNLAAHQAAVAKWLHISPAVSQPAKVSPAASQSLPKTVPVSNAPSTPKLVPASKTTSVPKPAPAKKPQSAITNKPVAHTPAKQSAVSEHRTVNKLKKASS